MTYIIGKSCIDVLDGSCVGVCPVHCIYSTTGDRQLFINPNECIDCAVCQTVCPVSAIFHEDEVPEDQHEFTKLNYEYEFDSSEPGFHTIRAKGSGHNATSNRV